jgi:hypothetical protein
MLEKGILLESFGDLNMIPLQEIADEKSVHVSLYGRNIEIESFLLDGTPCISEIQLIRITKKQKDILGTLDSSSFRFDVEYEPLNLDVFWENISTIKEIQKSLNNFSSLKKLCELRSLYTKKILSNGGKTLLPFILFDFLLLDEFGLLWKIPVQKSRKDVSIATKFIKENGNIHKERISPFILPDDYDYCPICKEQWVIDYLRKNKENSDTLASATNSILKPHLKCYLSQQKKKKKNLISHLNRTKQV